MKWHVWLAAALLCSAISIASAQASGLWVPVREISLEIDPGSPLDFSTFLPNEQIDEDRRLITSPSGSLAFAKTPDAPARMLCASLAWSPASGGFPDHDGADRYARQLAMHGYNVARLTFTDANLMFARQKDFDFDRETLDRFYYLLGALKRNGIYWIIDGLTSWRGAFGGYDDRWDPSGNFKLLLHLDNDAFAHWKTLQEKILGQVNPYTGLAPIDDPALALVILVNENSIEFESVVHDRADKPPYDMILAAPFNRWLATRYGSTAALAKVWRDLKADERLETNSVRLPADRYIDSPRMRDLQSFFIEVERASAARMSKAMRDLGYKGLISTYNNWATRQTALSRRNLDVVTMNTYHDWIGSYSPGSAALQTSSIADSIAYMRDIAAARWLGKPFVVSEYDHLFWNRYRYEAGLAIPAYAALQGWDVLCRHGHGPIVLRYGEPFAHKRAMLPYAIALDPVARAGETVAALLFRRGDVATSKITFPFSERGVTDLTEDMQAREPDYLTDLALVGRIGLRDSDRIEGDGIILQFPDQASSGGFVAHLKKSGVLASGNATDIATGLYESDTGEVVLDRLNGQLRISTPMTEAVAFSSLRLPAALGMLRVNKADGNGMIALASLDAGVPLSDARRLLLIFATDAHNTGMRFRDDKERVIEDFGRLPVLIRSGSVDLSVSRLARKWRVSPVGLDGVVHPPIKEGTGRVDFRLSNATPRGPTTYFLLEIEGDLSAL